MKKNRQFSSRWIKKFENREHWLSYWHQIKIMEGKIKSKDSLIEILIGNLQNNRHHSNRIWNIINESRCDCTDPQNND